MGELIGSVLPLSLGVVMSPLAIMALVAVLLSDQARVNGIAYLAGWISGIVAVTATSVAVFALLRVDGPAGLPGCVPAVRIILAVALILGGLWILVRGRRSTQAMAAAATAGEVAAAAPQLPGWLQSVSRFHPCRSFALGVGIFALNPVNASCAILAGLDAQTAQLDAVSTALVLVGFVVIGVLPIAVPVFLVLARGAAAKPSLDRLRAWIAGHTNLLNALLLFVIAGLQIQKAVAAWTG